MENPLLEEEAQPQVLSESKWTTRRKVLVLAAVLAAAALAVALAFAARAASAPAAASSSTRASVLVASSSSSAANLRRELQRNLKTLGLYKNAINGKWTTASKTAFAKWLKRPWGTKYKNNKYKNKPWKNVNIREALARDALAHKKCRASGLKWRSGHKTTYESFPDPGSDECVLYNGCKWSGWFAGCANQKKQSWVKNRDIAAIFPFTGLRNHEVCIRSGGKMMVVNTIDTCGDSDCNGCCTKNKGSKAALVDLESYTNKRWGKPDGSIEWADLGLPDKPIC